MKKSISELKKVILENDPNVSVSSGKVMKKQSVVFNQEGVFKYGIEANEKRISLHLMPMYANPKIKDQFEEKLSTGDFGKGCIRFKANDELDFKNLKNLIKKCSKEKFPCK